MNVGEPIKKIEEELSDDNVLNDCVKKVVKAVSEAGGNTLIVGGFIRDTLLDKTTNDRDLEVYHLSIDVLKSILEKIGYISEVGRSFGVLKFRTVMMHSPFDISVPRKDSKTDPGHKGFDVKYDPNMSIEEASRRRDLTINSLSYDPIAHKLYDFFGGLNDLDHRMLRATDQKTFIDDPLRVLRVMQFAGRLDFPPDLTLITLCKLMEDSLKELPKERIYIEFEKLLLKSQHPSAGLRLLSILGIDILFPELKVLQNVHQDFVWHPEGSVWKHTLLVVNEAAKLRYLYNDSKDKMIFMLAALLHDIGKPSTTEINEEGRIISHKHAEVGADIARDIMNRLTNENDIIEKVVALVRDHLFPTNYYQCKVKDSAIRRLARRVNIPMLVAVSKADKLGRTYEHQDDLRAERWLEEKYYELKLDQPDALKPLVMGRHLLLLGYQPGIEMGKILNRIYEAQLEGKFVTVDEGLKYAEEEKLIQGGN